MVSLKELSDISFKIKNGLITSTKPFYYFYDYEPTRGLQRSQWNDVQHLVLEFKDGYFDSQSQVIDLFVNFIAKHFKNLDNVVLFCIPASNIVSNNTRYGYFANEVCKKLGIENGFGHIEFKGKSEGKHLGNRDKKITDYIDIDGSFFQNKNIIIFDDVVTRGTTINEIWNLLLAYGGKPFFAVSIGKTEFSSFSENIPLLDDSFNEYTPIKIKTTKVNATPVKKEQNKVINKHEESEFICRGPDCQGRHKRKTAEEREKEYINKRKEENKDDLIEIDGKVYWKETIKKIDGKYCYISQEYNLETHEYDEYYYLLDERFIKYEHNGKYIYCTPINEANFYKAKIKGKLYNRNELLNISLFDSREYRPKDAEETKKIIKKNNINRVREKICTLLFGASFPVLAILTILGAILDNGEVALTGWGLGFLFIILAFIIGATKE